MKHALGICIIAIVVATTAPVEAGCTKPACFAQTTWHSGFTAVTIDSPVGSAQHKLAIDLIEANGGFVALQSDRVVLGWVPPDADQKLVGHHTIGSLHRGAGTLRAVRPKQGRQLRRPRTDDALVDFFEDVVTGRLASMIDKDADVVGPPLTGDTFDTPAMTALHAQSTAATEPLLPRKRPGPVKSLNTNGPPWTNDSMRNLVCVSWVRN